MPYGYNGKILHVDLSSAILSLEEPSEEFYRKYMGSKNLKAVAVRGTRKPDLADKEAFKALVGQGAKDFPTSMVSGMGKFGTSAAVGGQPHRVSICMGRCMASLRSPGDRAAGSDSHRLECYV